MNVPLMAILSSILCGFLIKKLAEKYFESIFWDKLVNRLIYDYKKRINILVKITF